MPDWKRWERMSAANSEKGELAQGLADAKARLEELRRQNAAAEARAAMFRNLVARFKSMIDAVCRRCVRDFFMDENPSGLFAISR